jgi:hypothetical protein
MIHRSVTLIARFERRKLARGAALVEGIVVVSLLMTIMAGGLFLHHLYSGVNLGGIWSDAGESAAPIDVDTDAAPSFFGVVSHTSGSASETASAHARAGGKSYTLSASDTVACNEVPQNERGDVLSLVGYISANIIPSFF